MRIALIGGGAAGLASAFYLSQQRKHELVLFEKQATLGGNVRTLGWNAHGSKELDDLNIDVGVIEFPASNNPRFSSLLQELDIETEAISGGSSSYFLENGTSYHMPAAIGRMPHFLDRLPRYTRLFQAALGFIPTLLRLRQMEHATPISDYLGDDVMSAWLKGLLTYGYSTPYPQIARFPANIAADVFSNISKDRDWMRIPGGVYRYMQAILDTCEIDVRPGTRSLQVSRQDNGVLLRANERPEVFDAAVLAIPPHEVLNVIATPTEDEQYCFKAWAENTATTIVHTDSSLYHRWHPPEYTEFDIFEKDGGQDAGYNAYLNRLVNTPTRTPPHYFLAYNLEDKISQEHILFRWEHKTTLFDSNHDTRSLIRSLNGQSQLYFAGAYLYDGLHEGAIESAWQAASVLGACG